MKFAVIFSLAVLVFAGLTTPVAHAQLGGTVLGGGSNLTLSPRYPEPNGPVTLELNDYSLNTTGASYTWFIDGKEIVEAKNERSWHFTAGELGTSMTVTVRTSLPGGVIVTAAAVIKPVRVDLLIEADTLVPFFYKGRALPSSGSNVRVTAVPFTGAKRRPDSYSYTWRVGEDVVGGGSRFGKNSVTFASGFERNVHVAVDVIDTDGSLIATKETVVPITDPKLYFYEVKPLEGIVERALGKDFVFVGDEVTVRAEPYFVDRTLIAQNPFIEWKLNNQTIKNPSNDQQEIVLRRSGQNGSFDLEFHVRNLRQLLQGVKGVLTINF